MLRNTIFALCKIRHAQTFRKALCWWSLPSLNRSFFVLLRNRDVLFNFCKNEIDKCRSVVAEMEKEKSNIQSFETQNVEENLPLVDLQLNEKDLDFYEKQEVQTKDIGTISSHKDSDRVQNFVKECEDKYDED